MDDKIKRAEFTAHLSVVFYFNRLLQMHQKDYFLSRSRSPDWDVRAIDLWKFARTGAQASGELPINALPRLLNEAASPPTPEGASTFCWHANGELRPAHADRGEMMPIAYLHLVLTGTLWLICQRCLAPYAHRISTSTRYWIVETEQQADVAPMDDDHTEVIVGSRSFDLLDLIDEELCLSLPLVPKHPVCSAMHEALCAEPEGKLERQRHPWSALALLLKPHKKSHESH